jgi:3-oxoacyl-[acyl-carrier protein] reductase
MAQTAIITGASRGIGHAIALKLARNGFQVVVNYAGNKAEAAAAVNEIEAQGGKALAIQGDVAKSADMERLFDEAEREFGGVDVVINNAGIMPLSPIADLSDETFDRILAVNLRGTFNTLKLAAKRLRDGGRIVNFSSTAVVLANPGYGAYNASKAAVEALTLVLARELRGRNITVNTIAPGPTATALFLNGKSEETIQRFAKAPPLERLGAPEDIANTVAFLVGPEGGWINGQIVRANGGIA